MTKRTRPTKQEIETETRNAWNAIQVFVNCPFRLRKIKVVGRIAGAVCQWTGDHNADGGAAVDITISTSGLFIDMDWRTTVWSRVGHEILHAKVDGTFRHIADEFSRTNQNDNLQALEEFAEECAKVVEAVVLWGRSIGKQTPEAL